MEDEIQEVFDRHGLFVMIVAADDEHPGFAYTIGLHRRHRHPELIVVGLRHEVMHAMLNDCGDRVAAGDPLPVDLPVAGILDAVDVRLRRVRAPDSYDEHVGYAIWFNGGRDFPLLQLVYPDLEGRFPGEPGVNPALAAQQPLLP